MEAREVACHQKKARSQRRVIVFVDESGLSTRPHRVRTWAPRGQTPVLHETFNWKSLRNVSKVPRHDFMVMIVVTLVTVLTNLAVAVVTGIVIAALVFAWDHAQQLEITIVEDGDRKTYLLQGSLFFASATQFTRFFTPKEDPAEVYLEFDHARIMDSSALEAIEAVAAKYQQLGKVLHVRGLSENCDKLLRRKDGMVTILAVEESEPA